MKLYYSPGACSLSPHIILCEGNFKFDLDKVDLAKKKTDTGTDYTKINPKGYVPALQLDTGEILTEGPVIVQYLADQVPNLQLIPSPNTLPRYHCQEWLNYISAEIHKTIGALFKGNVSDENKRIIVETVAKRFQYVDSHLSNNQYLMGDNFSIADAYLFTILRWTFPLKVDLQPWPSIAKYFNIIKQRSAVQAALQAEGL